METTAIDPIQFCLANSPEVVAQEMAKDRERITIILEALTSLDTLAALRDTYRGDIGANVKTHVRSALDA